MRIIQITDLHIGKEGEMPYDINVRLQFQKTLEEALSYQADHLVFSGDLCYREPRQDTYQWLFRLFTDCGLPFSTIPGNHDLSASIASIFEADKAISESGELYYIRNILGEPVMFLDSGRGLLSNSQLDWVRDTLAEFSDIRLIFMHHPPVKNGGVPYMDRKYSLQDPERFLDLLSTMNRHFFLFCGHYHVEKTIHIGNLSVHITPSTFFQIKQDQEEFGIDHSSPAFRIIDVQARQVMTTVRYLR